MRKGRELLFLVREGGLRLQRLPTSITGMSGEGGFEISIAVEINSYSKRSLEINYSFSLVSRKA
jgi:hypothetical protein